MIICEYNPKKLDISLINNISHRGHDSYGVSYFVKEKIINNYFKGKIDEDNIDTLQQYQDLLKIKYYIGHTRYSTLIKKKAMLKLSHMGMLKK